jgi:hypothetical protein
MTQVTSPIHIKLQDALTPLFRVIKNRILSDEEKSILERASSIPSPQEQNLGAERLRAKLQDQSNSLYA